MFAFLVAEAVPRGSLISGQVDTGGSGWGEQPRRECLRHPGLEVAPRSPVISCGRAVLLHPPPSLGISGLVRAQALSGGSTGTGHHGEGREWGPGVWGVVGTGVAVESEASLPPSHPSPGELRALLGGAGSWPWQGHGCQDEQEEEGGRRGWQEEGEAGEHEEGDGDCELWLGRGGSWRVGW